MAPQLVLGPLLRHVDATSATIWVETDGPAEVEVLGQTGRTFEVARHHYALLRVEGLEPGSVTRYGVSLDGELVWPHPDDPYPAPAIRTVLPGAELQVAWGSCRVSRPHQDPFDLPPGEDDEAFGIDAIQALAESLRDGPAEDLPHLLMWLGDQVYADDIPPVIRRRIDDRTDDRRGAPEDQIADFEEYTWLYHDAWGAPAVRWLLSTVPSAMVFDDHDVHDDWNTSRDWRAEFADLPWWHERIVGALASYWVYQHLGNLSPAAIAEDDLHARVVDHEGDVLPLLREMATAADEDPSSFRWSYTRDLCGTRIVVVDSRAARDLGGPERDRRMVDAEEWAWVREQCAGDHDHLFLATSVPVFVAKGIHWTEAASEALAAGAWGRRVAKRVETARRAADLEHWSAFGHSFEEMVELLDDVAAGRLGRAPASVVLLSGDVHHAYVDRVGFPRDGTARSPVLQAVCSPYRNPLPPGQRRLIEALHSRAAWGVARLLGRAAGVEDPPVGWRRERGPWFDNQLAWLELDGRRGRLRFQRAVPGPRLEDLGTLDVAD
ncbi:alkaline phosphatase D family protein [Patulibacter sp.]|uniref:DUF7800 domain-containing protein n=1 Tax=Patulibacter sp. TaxID=1912859 RepID=UPI00271AF65C|nr:alkaline phosphatase D family protein [Patulibacter sp.]MDO9408488.1 alkaline phosphatase D family protein [Patulibacter sp.]